MRVSIDHLTRYSYEEPAAAIVQILRVTPRSCDSQYVVNWRLDVDADGRVIPFTDAQGNACHIFYADRPLMELAIRVSGTVVTTDTNGVMSGCREPLTPSVYLRFTESTRCSVEIIALAEECRRRDELASAHGLMMEIHRRMRFVAGATQVATHAAEAFIQGQGVCQDLAQIFISAARHLGIPARYVSGHFAAPDHPQQEASHAWAEAFIDRLGWVAFDPTQAMCATEGHVRVAVGMDAQDAAPIRGSRKGGGTESLAVEVHGRENIRRAPGTKWSSGNQT